MKQRFVRQNILRKGLKVKWRKPKGIHSKLRLNKAGHIKKPSPGFRSRRKDRVKLAVIKNINELANAKQSALISSKLGMKKKIEIVKRAQELKLNVLNIKNPEEFIRNANEMMEKKKQEKKKKTIEKKRSKENVTKGAEKEKKKEEEKSKDTQKEIQGEQDKQG